jgi:signal peptidase I
MRGRRFRRICATLVAVLGLVVIVALATGEVALVTTHGISMEPRFHTGDLAIVVPASEYHVGEIVGYHSPLLHIVVLHRIVAERAGLFTFKGDNNDFLDPVRVPASAIEGRLWARIPHAGIVLGWVRSPIGLGILAFVLFTFVVGGASRRHRAQRRGARVVVERAQRRPARLVVNPAPAVASNAGPKHAAAKAPPAPRWPVAVPVALACAFALLATEAWSLPLGRPSERPVAYVQHVTFSYAAKAPRGTTYPTGSVSTKDPVFVHLVKTLTLTALYQFDPVTPGRSSVPATSLSGTIGATVALQGPGGWSGQVAAVSPTSFSGTTASVHVSFALARLSALESAFNSETGMVLGATNIMVTPTVHVRGSVGGAEVNDSFSPILPFQLNGQELNLVSTGSYGAAPTFPQLTPKQSGTAGRPVRVPAQMAILGRSLDVAVARVLWVGAMAASIVVAFVLWVWFGRRRRMDAPTRIRATYGHDLVAVTTSPAADAPLVVEVESFGALARLAQRYDCVILELEHPDGHAYYVECGATVYRCGVEPAPDKTTWRIDDPDRPADMTFHVAAMRSVS